MFKVATLNKISPHGLDRFDTKRYTYGDDLNDADAIMVRSAALHDTEFPTTLKAIARAGAGVNNIPIDRCSENGIVVFNTPGANANAVKELVITGLFLSSRKIVPAIEWAKTLKGEGEAVAKLVEKGKGAFVGPEISGKKLGVIGLGAIGVLVANAAHSLGMEVYGYDPFLSVDGALHLSRSVKKVDSLKDIYENCDYITLHVPLNNETKGMINEESILLMKDGVRILNFSRAALVSSECIIKALEKGKVSSYVVDFPTDEVLDVPGVVAIPHLGASTPESEDNCARMAAEELIDYLENGNITNSVNLPNVIQPRQGKERICVIHKNVPNMLATISGVVSKENYNIENMVSSSKKDYAYTILDVSDEVSDVTKKAIQEMENVIKVRVIR
jgi:D-3-phosphoglycerate dehydrogenase